MSHSRRRTYRREDKQISFFTSSEIHESIKLQAKQNNTSIKDYLVRLHINATNDNSQDNLIAEVHVMMKRLLDTQAFLVVPQQQQSNPSSNLMGGLQSTSVNPNAAEPHRFTNGSPSHLEDESLSQHTGMRAQNKIESQSFDNIPYSDGLTFSPKLELYLSSITRVNTYETMRKIIFSLYKLKEATHYQINKEIGHTTHNQPRALKRAVEDRIILVDEPDNPKEPYYYRLNPAYL
ncbi:MAG: hypothetical protein GPJ54_09805 [Candidatus Heimdallarchaeota archaeon]|nr:hypothetical protein [Candidatus Heimdallarchaeota archaeon]